MRKRILRKTRGADRGEQAPLPPGVPGSEPASVAEPTGPRPPLPPKPDQGTPEPVSPTGQDTGDLRHVEWDVREFAGRTAQFQILDDATGAWGHLIVDQILHSD